MASFNKVILVGNLGRDPELRYIPDGTAVCSFSLATNERRKSKSGDYQDVTTWFNVTLWRRQAELQPYLAKAGKFNRGRCPQGYQYRDGIRAQLGMPGYRY